MSFTYIENLLIYIFLSPIIGILFLLAIPSREKNLLKVIALNSTCFSFLGSLLLWGVFHKGTGAFQFVIQYSWFLGLNLNVTLGIDGISIFFLLLTTLLIPLCLLASWNSVKFNLKEFLIAFLVLDFFFNRHFLYFRFTIFLYFF